MLKKVIILFFILVHSESVDAGVFVVRPHFEPYENYDDLVGIRYHLRLDENVFENTGKIIFNGSHLYNPDYHLTGYAPAIETNFYNYMAKLPRGYVDMGCVTSGGHGRPSGATTISGIGSIIVGIVDWWREYPEFLGRVGMKSIGQTAFPTFSMTVDGIDGLTKSTAESQFGMTGKDVQLELVRGETIISPLDGWGAHWLIDFNAGGQYCEDNLQPDTLYRKWYLTLTIDGVAYRFEFVVFEKVGRYLYANNPVVLMSEFFELDSYIRAYYWGFEVIREGSEAWVPLDTFKMTEHIFDPLPNRDYGPKLAIYDGHYVLEISNDHTGSIDEAGTYYQKGDVFSFPDPSSVNSLPTINWALPHVTASENQGGVELVAKLDIPAPAEIKVAVSKREAGRTIEHDLLRIPTGGLTGTLSFALDDDTAKQPDRQMEFFFDSSSTVRFGPQYKMVLNVIDDDLINDAPTRPAITAIPGLSCTTLSPRWSAATDASGPIVSYNVYRKDLESEYVLVRQVNGKENKSVDRVPLPGSYTYAISAVDVFGLEGPKSEPFTSATPTCVADSTPPTGTILAPVDGAVVAGLMVVEMEVSDDDPLGVNSVDLYRDNEIFIDTIFLSLNQSFTLDVTTLAEGPHTLFIRVHDFGGNVHQSIPVNVIVSHNIPSKPTGLNVSLINADTIELRWDDPPLPDVSLVSHYEVMRDGNLIDTSMQAYYLDLGLSSSDVYCYAVVAVSNSGVSSELSRGVCTDSAQIIGDLDGDGDVDVDDMAIIVAARNTPSNGPDDPRDLDEDGQITVSDARKLVLLCTRPRCAID